MSRSDNPDKDLPFKVEALHKDGTFYRTISLNVNIYVARAAFHMAMIEYPNDRLRLKHGSLVVEDTARPAQDGQELPLHANGHPRAP